MAFAAMFLDSFVFFVVKRLPEIPNAFVFYHWNHYLFVRTIPIGKDQKDISCMLFYVGFYLNDMNILNATVFNGLLIHIHFGICNELLSICVRNTVMAKMPIHKGGIIAMKQIVIILLSRTCRHLTLVYTFGSAGSDSHE